MPFSEKFFLIFLSNLDPSASFHYLIGRQKRGIFCSIAKVQCNGFANGSFFIDANKKFIKILF